MVYSLQDDWSLLSVWPAKTTSFGSAWTYVWKREINVYDRRLEAITAAAELGSFSRAAAKLRVSTPALVKQVSGFEAEFGITLFERSHSGV